MTLKFGAPEHDREHKARDAERAALQRVADDDAFDKKRSAAENIASSHAHKRAIERFRRELYEADPQNGFLLVAWAHAQVCMEDAAARLEAATAYERVLAALDMQSLEPLIEIHVNMQFGQCLTRACRDLVKHGHLDRALALRRLAPPSIKIAFDGAPARSVSRAGAAAVAAIGRGERIAMERNDARGNERHTIDCSGKVVTIERSSIVERPGGGRAFEDPRGSVATFDTEEEAIAEAEAAFHDAEDEGFVLTPAP